MNKSFISGLAVGVVAMLIVMAVNVIANEKLASFEVAIDNTPIEVKVVGHKNPGSFMREYCIVESTGSHQRYMIEGDFGKEGETFMVDPSLLSEGE